jgi:hypothetical protein
MLLTASETRNRWTVVMVLDTDRGRPRLCVVRCTCGRVLVRNERSVRCGLSRSCGHDMKSGRRRHGHSGDGKFRSKEYNAWLAMRRRCSAKPGTEDYANYVARGITVCARWQTSFENFLGDVGLAPSKAHSIERKDNSGSYEPANVTWADRKTQSRNRRSTLMVYVSGRNISVAELAESHRLPLRVVRRRVKDGWSADEAVTEPIRRMSK